MPRIKADLLETFVTEIFSAAGCSAEESARIDEGKPIESEEQVFFG